MKNHIPILLILGFFAHFGTTLLGDESVKSGTNSVPIRATNSLADVNRKLVLRVRELEAENSRLRAEVAELRAKMGSTTNSSEEIRRGSPNSPQRLRVSGDSRRDVYAGPGGGLRGKAEPGSIVRVLQKVEVNGLTWYLVQLEKGEMYTVATDNEPSRTIIQGWLWEMAVEPVQ